MRNAGLEALDVLMGEWSLILTDAGLLESRNVRQMGHAVVRQRFVAVTNDRIHGRWDASEDAGHTWRKDFDLIFERTDR